MKAHCWYRFGDIYGDRHNVFFALLLLYCWRRAQTQASGSAFRRAAQNARAVRVIGNSCGDRVSAALVVGLSRKVSAMPIAVSAALCGVPEHTSDCAACASDQ